MIDWNDKNINKRPLCNYCKLPINKSPMILSNEKVFPFIILNNHIVHPECHGPYISHIKNIIVGYISFILAVSAIFLTIYFKFF